MSKNKQDKPDKWDNVEEALAGEREAVQQECTEAIARMDNSTKPGVAKSAALSRAIHMMIAAETILDIFPEEVQEFATRHVDQIMRQSRADRESKYAAPIPQSEAVSGSDATDDLFISTSDTETLDLDPEQLQMYIRHIKGVA